MSFTCLKRCLTRPPIWKKRLFSTRYDEVKQVLIYGDSNTWGYNPEYCKSFNKAIQRFPYQARWTTICQKLLGDNFVVIPEGLNGRTTILHDIEGDGDYECDGRHCFSEILHSHKPLDLVIISLSANDFKGKFGLSVHDIARGVRVLIRDVQKQSNIGVQPAFDETCYKGLKSTLLPPKILVVGPPFMKVTSLNKLWGIKEDIDKESRRLNGLLSVMCKELQVNYLPIGSMVNVSALDGVHYDKSEQPIIGKIVADKILELIGND
jgi:hypothetical protein